MKTKEELAKIYSDLAIDEWLGLRWFDYSDIMEIMEKAHTNGYDTMNRWYYPSKNEFLEIRDNAYYVVYESLHSDIYCTERIICKNQIINGIDPSYIYDGIKNNAKRWKYIEL